MPLALALATPARTRSTIMLRSNSANTPVAPRTRDLWAEALPNRVAALTELRKVGDSATGFQVSNFEQNWQRLVV
jgi:hypothetical protein